MPHDSKETYIGDGVYASLDPARMIVLSTQRWERFDMSAPGKHWIAIEPEVLHALVVFACEIGWDNVVANALQKGRQR